MITPVFAGHQKLTFTCSADTGCYLEDLPRVMVDGVDGERAIGLPWWFSIVSWNHTSMCKLFVFVTFNSFTGPVTWFGHRGTYRVVCLAEPILLQVNSKFSFLTSCHTKVKKPNLLYSLLEVEYLDSWLSQEC